jgi:ABC-type Fe3+ transport system permease subunit
VNTRASREFLINIPLATLLALSVLPLLFVVSRVAAQPAVDLTSLLPALAFALAGAAVSTVCGGAMGLAASTLELPARRVAVGVSILLLAAPPAFWWIGVTRLPFGIGRMNGIAPASGLAGLTLAPITLILVLAALREVPTNSYEAARVLLGPVRRFWWVLIPLVRPALIAGFLVATIVLLGESELPFLFGFRTAMTDVVTAFSQTFDPAVTVPIVVPLVVTVLAIALLTVKPLFDVLLAGAAGERGVIRRPVRMYAGVAAALPPLLVVLSLAGYLRAAVSGGSDVWRRAQMDLRSVAESIGEPVLCAFVAVGLAVLAAYPARRSRFARVFAVIGLLLFCVPTAVIAIGWIRVGQVLGGVSIRPGIAYVSRMTGLAVLAFLVAYGRLPRSLESAAQLVPLTSARRAWALILPLVATSLAASSALAAAMIFADRDVASLLLAPGESRLMLNLYLLSANAPSAVIGTTALMVLVAGGIVVALAAAGPALLWLRRRA